MDPKSLFVVHSTQGLKAAFWPLLSSVMESPLEGAPAKPSGSEMAKVSVCPYWEELGERRKQAKGSWKSLFLVQ